MNVNIIAIGKLKDKFYLDAAKEYVKMISGFARINMTEIEAARLSINPSGAEVKKALEAEAAKITAALPAGGFNIAMCVEGRQMTSMEFAKLFDGGVVSAYKSTLSFIVGSSYGLSENLKRQADMRLSMSEMTFPHRLSRIMLLEQIYRALSIINGRKYHK